MSPTVDRIDNDLGYTKENTRFVIWGVNALRGTGDDDVMYLIAEAITISRMESWHDQDEHKSNSDLRTRQKA